jgi:hypothetical protein
MKPSSSFAAWQQLVTAHTSGNSAEYAEALDFFLSQDADRIDVLRAALRGPERNTAIRVLPKLPQSELQQLFDELIFLASFSHGALNIVRQLIVSLSRAWVLNHIQDVAEPYLANGTYDEYRRLLELYIELDHHLTVHLARRAAAHNDIDIREAGEDFIKRLQ